MFNDDLHFQAILNEYLKEREYDRYSELISKMTFKSPMNDGKIHFYLPGFYEHSSILCCLIEIFDMHPEYFMENIEIGAVYDAFPGTVWNGGRYAPSFINQTCSYGHIKETIDTYNAMGIPIRYTFTNSLVDEHMVHEPYGNLQLELGAGRFNEVLVNSEALEAHIRKNYPDYKVILSTTRCERDPVKTLENTDRYDMVVMDYRDNKNPEFINQITRNRDKIEILVNEQCSADCAIRKEHYKLLSQANIARTDFAYKCPYESNPQFPGIRELIMRNPKTVITREDLYARYVRLGFRNFKLEGRFAQGSRVIDHIAYYMAKPEYEDMIKMYLVQKTLFDDKDIHFMMGQIGR